MHAEVEQLRGADERLQRLAGEIDKAAAAWRAQAERLTASRRSAAAELSATTTGIIAELGMGGGQFLIELEPQDAGKPDPQGAERVEFLVAANAGQPPRAPAQGGLRWRTVAHLAGHRSGRARPGRGADDGVRRVDSGIGGAVADIVGQKLRALGEKRQVLCVTHLPQVASRATPTTGSARRRWKA